MPKNKEVKKPNVIGGDKSYIPTKEKEIEEETYVSIVKITMLDGKEYKLGSLSSLDLKRIEVMQTENEEKKDKGLSNYDMTFKLFLFAFKKFNPGMKDMDLDKFMDIFPLVDIDKKIEEVMGITGLDFKKGVGKK